MARTDAQKVADALVQGCSSLNWNVQIFVGELLEQPPRVQKAIIMTMLTYLRQYQHNASNPYLNWRTDPDSAELIEAVDLTAFDQPW